MSTSPYPCGQDRARSVVQHNNPAEQDMETGNLENPYIDTEEAKSPLTAMRKSDTLAQEIYQTSRPASMVITLTQPEPKRATTIRQRRSGKEPASSSVSTLEAFITNPPVIIPSTSDDATNQALLRMLRENLQQQKMQLDFLNKQIIEMKIENTHQESEHNRRSYTPKGKASPP